ncbi:collagen alpha-1(I) chain-like isoform X7 [Myiozetetes cayanensis]|uniref:collagen alpha-1(I) chain-like isoform X7 n=1 Tax=Myiozetetes cayanensis TaxID=478635 RepID=UPI00215F2EAB|nr:collagen alpha-1(I) chain-like isoform X7 [Myiozetetes cayanensis]
MAGGTWRAEMETRNHRSYESHRHLQVGSAEKRRGDRTGGRGGGQCPAAPGPWLTAPPSWGTGGPPGGTRSTKDEPGGATPCPQQEVTGVGPRGPRNAGDKAEAGTGTWAGPVGHSSRAQARKSNSSAEPKAGEGVEGDPALEQGDAQRRL